MLLTKCETDNTQPVYTVQANVFGDPYFLSRTVSYKHTLGIMIDTSYGNTYIIKLWSYHEKGSSDPGSTSLGRTTAFFLLVFRVCVENCHEVSEEEYELPGVGNCCIIGL